MTELPGVSYVMPVLNESAYLEEAVSSILNQDYPGQKELVLALGPSTDDTNDVARRLAEKDERIILVDNPKGRTPSALNLAVEASTMPVIARVDAHSELPRNYTKRGVETLYRVGAYDVGGLMDARGRTPLQRAIAAAYNSPFGFGGAAYHSGAPEGPAESAYLGIFRREVFEDIGMYDESMWRAQDWELCHRIRSAGHKVWFDPELKVGYYPRETFSALAAQSFASGTWRAEIARRYSNGQSLRHALPPLMVAGVTAGSIAAIVASFVNGTRNPVAKRALAALSLAPALYGAFVAVAGLKSNASTLKEKALTAAVFPSIHFPWAIGYIRGRVFGAQGTVDKGRVK
ncbi:glycosyltransferase family 2 protein [Glutamicibacter sp. MNS18]|uniref:glycosyltransferase family 2 protein n=1 Tax=Glutamicibacter sp. MNS18 TaxID=2989817 RepID=UPI0022360A7D|nr:glycosyltransferase family 2 protein [Glutamicibacter sp. MNS18]MCW4466203.1 glycosyltransferase family 2 protein [Glutamicibacter sp. MNS18]